MKETKKGIISIFIANLAKYSAGELVGKWVTLPVEEDELQEVFNSIGCFPNGDEYFISDCECSIDGVEIDEYGDIERLNTVSGELLALDDTDIKTVAAIIECTGYSLDEAIDCLNDVIFYEGYKLEDVAYEFVDEGIWGDIPEFIKPYIDYEAIAQQVLSCDDYYETKNGVIYVE